MRLSRIFWGICKILFASLITGTVLAALNITVKEVFPSLGDQIDKITNAAELVVNWLVVWSVPNIMVGAVVIVPIWLILLAFGPKR